MPGFHRITFAPDPALQYAPGQFLTFVHEAGGQELRRSYSLLTVPGIDTEPAIGVRRIDNGAFSRYLCDVAEEGTVLQCAGVGGLFRLPQAKGPQHLFFLAAGSGITPIYSLLRSALFQHPGLSVVLVYSNHAPRSTPFRAGLEQLAEAFPGRFQLHLLFGTDPDLSKARLNRHLLLALLQREAASRETWFYTCGPESYMRMCLFVLRSEGFPADHIRREDFLPPPANLGALKPPDTAPHEVRLYWRGEGFRFQVAWPETILKAALRLGLHLPYSCGAGRCGSCVASCVEGRTWLAHNEVLTDADLARGLTLTCSAFPLGGPVILRLDETPLGNLLKSLGEFN